MVQYLRIMMALAVLAGAEAAIIGLSTQEASAQGAAVSAPEQRCYSELVGPGEGNGKICSSINVSGQDYANKIQNCRSGGDICSGSQTAYGGFTPRQR